MRSLRDSGIAVEYHDMPTDARAQVDGVLDVLADGRRARFAPQVKKRAPYPGELQRLQVSWERLSRLGHPLLVVPFVSDALGTTLSSAGWSWADTQGNFDVHAPGLWLRQRRSFSAPAARKRTLPQGAGSSAVIRALIRFRADEAEEAGARPWPGWWACPSREFPRYCTGCVTWNSSTASGTAGGGRDARRYLTASSPNTRDPEARNRICTGWTHRPTSASAPATPLPRGIGSRSRLMSVLIS